MVEKRLFKVLLDQKLRIGLLRVDKPLNLLQISEYLDPAALVHSCWLDEPNVALAVLHGQPLFHAVAFGQLFEALAELFVLVVRILRC